MFNSTQTMNNCSKTAIWHKLLMVMNKRILGAMLRMLGLTLTSSVAMSQGIFDVKIASQKIDCANRKVLIEVQVKAHDDKNAFMMGDANYRFAYNPSVLRNPTIVKQGHFSNEGEAIDAHYGGQNLTGSVARMNEGIVSLNTFYGGTGDGAKTVETEYMTVSTIAFDLIDPKSITEIKWHEGAEKFSLRLSKAPSALTGLRSKSGSPASVFFKNTWFIPVLGKLFPAPSCHLISVMDLGSIRSKAMVETVMYSVSTVLAPSPAPP